MATDLPVNPRIRQLIIKSSSPAHLHQVESEKRLYNGSESLHTTSPTHLLSGSSINSRRDSLSIPSNAINLNYFQPSLAAGGVVDLSRTFTPTRHGTFSFGGKNKLTRIPIKKDMPIEAMNTRGLYSDRKSLTSSGLNLHQHQSTLKGLKITSSTNTSEISLLVSAVGLPLKSTE